MFSPEASIQSTRSSLRNPRRRPRNSDGAQQQQPRRKRSKLGDETFTSVADAQTNGNGSALMNGHAGNGSVESSMVLVEMPVREKKGTAKRALKDDSALYLVGTSPLIKARVG
jgi:nuclear pore complex protein Nup133